jgi:murein DD-endopeptidase MepM/ murein hydrolase activator NlpD
MISADRSSGLFINPKIPLITVLVVSFMLAWIFTRVTAASTEIVYESESELVFMAPYDDYVITQGLHGYSYGHMAIDLSSGKGAVIKSPINGVVSENYIDGLGNPTLVIENELYRVTLLHGIYSVSIGDRLHAGQPVGTESNLGFTTDMQGNPCAGRECGYHSHLNVYNKHLGANVSPLDLINP